jgi:hypothetical protein
MQIDRQIEGQRSKGSSTLMPVPGDGATCSDRHTGQARGAEGRYTSGDDQQSMHLELFAAHWWSVSTNFAGLDGNWQFSDTNAASCQMRFYRSLTR